MSSLRGFDVKESGSIGAMRGGDVPMMLGDKFDDWKQFEGKLEKLINCGFWELTVTRFPVKIGDAVVVTLDSELVELYMRLFISIEGSEIEV